MYVDEPPKDGNIPDFNISKIDICPFRAYQRSFRLFQSDFSTDIHQRSRLLCFTQNDDTGQTGFKICPFLKWAQVMMLLKDANAFQEFGTSHNWSIWQANWLDIPLLTYKIIFCTYSLILIQQKINFYSCSKNQCHEPTLKRSIF